MRLTLKLKLAGSFGVLAAALIGVANVGILQLQEYDRRASHIAYSLVPAQGLVLNADRDAQQALVAERSLLVLTPGSDQFLAQLDARTENIAQIEERMTQYGELIDAGWSDAILERFWPQFAAWKDASGAFVEDLSRPTGADRAALARRSLSDLDVKFAAMRDVIDSADAELESLIREEEETASAAYKQSRALMIGATVGALALGLLSALWTLVSLSRGLGRAQAALGRLASGDLRETAEIRGTDEIAKLLASVNAVTLKLRGVVGDVFAGVRNVAAGSNDLATTAQQLSQGATEQATSTEQASAAVEQMTANIKQTAHSASETEGVAARAAQEARLSGESVNEAVTAVRTIAERIQVVQEIARQTDLLALNAAVEAARAGEAGRGFAVVASEVRKLAERSQGAAREIGQLSTRTVQTAETAGRRIDGLVPEIERTAGLVSQISTANQELATGAAQVALAVEQLNQVTQENTSASEQVSSTAGELAGQAEVLRAGMGFFRTGGADVAVPVNAAPVQEPPRAQRTTSPKVGRGFAFDLTGTSDEDELDAQFTRKAVVLQNAS